MSQVAFNIKIETNQGASIIDGISSSLTNASGKVGSFQSAVSKIGGAAFVFNNIRSAVSGIASDFNAAIQPGIDFNSQLKDLQAITGVTEAELQKIGRSARENAKEFGVDAAKGIESYKLILSQLGPEIAKQPAALDAMGRSAVILSKQLQGDVAGATGILTTAMNQYGVSTDDPIRASKDMALMMDIMSAAAKEGSAELPNIASALEQSGMMAKTANIPFNELNAAIQILDKSGKKGAEGGVALRNAISILGEGEFMGKAQKAMLEAAGIDVTKLGDKSLTLAQRLKQLEPIMGDNAAMTLLFGRENAAAGIALVQNSDNLAELTTKITGTHTAQEMANTVMSSFAERTKRANAWLKDMGISLFNATDGFLPFIQIGGGALQMAANFGGAISAVSLIAETKFGQAMAKAAAGTMAFARSSATAIVSVVRQGAVMGFNAVVAVGGYIGSIIAATAAQIGLNAAMYANPIGLIILGIAAAVAAVVGLIYYWDEIWAAIKAFTKWMWDHSPFGFLIDIIEKVFPGFKQAMEDLWGWIKKKFTDLIDWFKNTWKSIKGFFSFGGDDEAGTKEQAQAMESAVTEAVQNIEVKAVVEDETVLGKTKPVATDKSGSKASKEMSSNISSGGNRPTTINLTIHKLQDQIVVHTTNLQTGARDAGRQIVEEILMALNSVNGKAQAV